MRVIAAILGEQNNSSSLINIPKFRFSAKISFLLGLGLCWVTTGRACPTAEGCTRTKVAVAAAGVGPKWDRYVEYVHRLAERIQTDCIQEQTSASTTGLTSDEVMGWVLLNRRGEVTEIVDLEGPGALVEPVRRALAAGMAEHHTYGIWPEEMAKDLGDERQVAMGFHFPGIAVPSSVTASSASAPFPAP